MIFDRLQNAQLYATLCQGMKEALAFIQRADLMDLPLGRHDLPCEGGEPGDVYALVQQYNTRHPSEVPWEAHRAFYDVQFVVSGVERMDYANVQTLDVTKEYDADGDYLLLAGEGISFVMPAGSFAIFGPQDAHRPAIAVDEPVATRKIVVKVRFKV